MVLAVYAHALSPTDQRQLRDIWRLEHDLDPATQRRLTITALCHAEDCTRMSLWRHHTRALGALHAALLAWHAAHPEEASRPTAEMPASNVAARTLG